MSSEIDSEIEYIDEAPDVKKREIQYAKEAPHAKPPETQSTDVILDVKSRVIQYINEAVNFETGDSDCAEDISVTEENDSSDDINGISYGYCFTFICEPSRHAHMYTLESTTGA